MLLLLERDQFIKLFKFGEIKISVNRFIDGYDVEAGKTTIPIKLLDAKMPLFEQDHEVLILEIPKENVTIGTEISVKIRHIRKIFPLSEEASKYLIGRMHPSIVIQKPVFESQVNEVKKNRDFDLRIKAWESLASIFQIDKTKVIDYSEEIIEGIKARISLTNKHKHKKYLHNLICFNRNPIYPQGNIEYLFKAGSVFVQMKDGTESDFEQGPYYKFLNNNISEFSKLDLGECISNVKRRVESKGLIDELSKQYPKIDALTVGVCFLYFRDILNKSNYNLVRIKDDIEILKIQKPIEIAIVLQMIGMFFNFDNLYGSLYELRPIPIFNKEVDPLMVEQNKNFKIYKQELENKSDQMKNELDRKEEMISNLNHKITNEYITLKDSQMQISLLINSVKELEPVLFDELKGKKSGILDFSFLKDFIQELKIRVKEPKQIIVAEKEGQNVLDENAEAISKTGTLEVHDVAAKIIYDQPTLKETPVAKEYSSDDHHDKVAESDEIEKGVLKEPATDSLQNRADLDDQKEKFGKLNSEADKSYKEVAIIGNPDETNFNKFSSELKPITSSESKSKPKKPKAETQSKKGSIGKLDKSSVNLTKDSHVSQTILFSESDTSYYNEDDLKGIVKIVKERRIFSEPKDEQTFIEAILGYSPKGANQDPLVNEVDELQKDLKLLQEVTDQLKSIILEVKK